MTTDQSQRPTIYLDSLGCRLNEAELEGWARAFHSGGCRRVAEPESANLVVLNSCAVTAEAARKSRQFVRRIHRRNPSARLVVTGCYAELEPVTVAELTGVDVVLGNEEKERLVEKLLDDLDIVTMPGMATEPDGAHLFATGRTRAFVKVQDGCRHRCTFCIVTIARGDERSREIQTLVDEINALHRDGYQEAVLTGVHLGGYGHDLGTDLTSLVGRVLAETSIPRIRLSSIEPWDLPVDFWALWRNPRLMPHIHLPLQSGADSVLKRMGRRCDTEGYRRLVAEARAAIGDLTLTTDIIVGFPGETDAEWADTLSFARESTFGHIHIFTYSPRQGTAAAGYPGHLPAEVTRARSRELHAVAEETKHAYLSRFVGSTRPVLWESVSGGSEDDPPRWRGLTDNYLRVEAFARETTDHRNRITNTRLTGVTDGRLVGSPIV